MADVVDATPPPLVSSVTCAADEPAPPVMVPSLPAAACSVAGADALPAAHAVDSRATVVSWADTALSSACCALTTLACAAFTAATG